MSLLREPDDQSQETKLASLRYRTGTGKGSLKIDRSVKMSSHKLNMGVARSNAWAPDHVT